MGRVWLRTFTHPTPTSRSHAYLIGSTVGGLSERVGSFMIHDELTTFRDLRQMIEVVNDNGMNRRTAMYQDLLYLMESSANPHSYERKALLKYRFGTIEGIGERFCTASSFFCLPPSSRERLSYITCFAPLGGQELGDTNVARDYDKSLTPQLIDSELEEKPVKEVIDNLLELDILLVPVSQIRPQDSAVTMQVWIDEMKTEEEVMKESIAYINSIDLTKYSPEKVEMANRNEEEELMEKADNSC